jgi:copper chaperone
MDEDLHRCFPLRAYRRNSAAQATQNSPSPSPLTRGGFGPTLWPVKHLTMPVGGMTCGGCVAAVRNVLARQPGVSGVQVEIGKVDLDYDEGAVTVEGIAQSIRKAGYEPQTPAPPHSLA